MGAAPGYKWSYSNCETPNPNGPFPHLLVQNVKYSWDPQRLSSRYIESSYVLQDTAVAHYLHLGTHWKLPYPPVTLVPCYSIGHEIFECQSSALFHHEVGEYTSPTILVIGLIRSIACTTMNISVLENCCVGFCFHTISASPIPTPCLLSECSLKE